MKELLYKRIKDNHLYVWRVTSCSRDLSPRVCLVKEEQNEFRVLKTEKRKVEFLACRLALKTIFSNKLILQHLNSGKPFIDEAPHISISHSNNYIAIVFGKENIGLDIELPQEKMQSIISRVLSADENNFFLKNPSAILACKLWGIKEATLKYIGDKKLSFRQDIKINKNSVSCLNHQLAVHHEIVDQMIVTYVKNKI
ncbi:4'-phosphopantetheinyl transferase superfamily protein [Flavobacteriales bacterium]|nr:4'-phosphopantetheinyl transferase superfamily protein [Flavobacteriales bacterium]MDG1145776.1 4'-phosphopantetheinyl transferase superfamily protein [Flavobacteriales bacterium]MDG1395582.1 4'-phosphopantetheinyl transferase superfamily protein [Flavobacteriales bacterium]